MSTTGDRMEQALAARDREASWERYKQLQAERGIVAVGIDEAEEVTGSPERKTGIETFGIATCTAIVVVVDDPDPTARRAKLGHYSPSQVNDRMYMPDFAEIVSQTWRSEQARVVVVAPEAVSVAEGEAPILLPESQDAVAWLRTRGGEQLPVQVVPYPSYWDSSHELIVEFDPAEKRAVVRVDGKTLDPERPS